ncbi:HSF-type DNA-binding-domain-containing protein [Epithele typhae]|uniref:HSF-type DNA-binding-domain-containing protein n=1 Tax=Epithele typhae TaxID=378194 RepID=UPI0020077AD0|nr:HSF-type DNA-binding-domain-containing protein [Epithele typhae]KAH9943077.1 HSF-type DNA-binding-domain-containing protein [Epithele typhae]
MSADLFPQSAYSRSSYPSRADQPYSLPASSSVVYPPQLLPTQPSLSEPHSPDASSHPSPRDSQSPKQENAVAQKQDGSAQQQPAKPQATFLTKLYALLERPENHHMIRWDQAGEHIIVERPEQLALHVLPSVYRQSRFASFSRQLNIYGFMRKVNLRNVDPAIEDPDASTWSHPTLNRHSSPDVVANFKRRVPPRLPKPRKRDNDLAQLPPPRSAIGTGHLPLSIPAGDLSPYKGGRARGFSAPGSFTPLGQPGAGPWGTSYPRSTLPPLNVPSDAPSLSSHGSLYSQSSHTLHPVSPTEDTQSSGFSSMTYSSSGRESMMLPSPSSYQYPDQQSNWSFSPSSASNAHSSGSLSSLLNPSSNGYSGSARPQPSAINTYSSSSYAPIGRGHHSAGPVSPDSRPTSGYSASSMSSLPTPYEDSNAGHYSHDYSRPGSGHHRPMSPSSSRPPSSKSYANGSGLSIRRERRHSQAMSPYPSPYSEHPSQRPSTSPHPPDDHGSSGAIPRVRSMIQLPSVEASYSFNPAQGDFAYAVDENGSHGSGLYGAMPSRSVRPSTSASSLSTTSSAANTPGADGYGNGAGEADITRYSPDYGFVPMNEHLPQYSKSEL